MSFGWSVGDVANLAKLAYEIYRFCEAAPAELQDLFDRFAVIARKLENLQSILERSGLERWEAPGDVKERLLSAKDDLSPFQYIADKDRSFGSRIKGLGHLAISQEKLKRIDKDLTATDRGLDDMKIDLIIACSLRTLQYVTQHPPALQAQPSPTDRTVAIESNVQRLTRPTILLTQNAYNSSSDAASVTSDVYSGVQQAFTRARQLSRRGRNTASGGIHRLHQEQTQEFLSEITSIAESMELYDETVDLIANFDRLVAINETATSYDTMSVYSDDTGSAESMDNIDRQASSAHSGDRFRRTDFLGSFTFERPTMQHRKSSGANSARSRLSPVSTGGQSYGSVFGRSNSIQYDAVSVHSTPSNEEVIQLLDRAKVTLTADVYQAQDCFFLWEHHESSLRLKVISAGTESTGFRLRQSHASSKALASFQHCLDQGVRPIPHLLHPSVEGPKMERDAPYTIAFTERQYVSYDNAPQEPRWSTGLRYVFFNKEDRDHICSRIFGKRMITTVGCDLITCDGTDVSQMSALTLWEDEADDSKSLSITFSLNMTKTASEDIEYRVHGVWDPSKPIKVKSGAKFISLAIESMPRSLDESLATLVDTTQRRSSTVSSSTTSSLFRRFSADSRSREGAGKRTTSETNIKRIKCILKLHESRASAQLYEYLLHRS